MVYHEDVLHSLAEAKPACKMTFPIACVCNVGGPFAKDVHVFLLTVVSVIAVATINILCHQSSTPTLSCCCADGERQ
jgi:hypothetical protein